MVAVIDSPGDIATPPAEDAVVATAERRRKHATDKLTSHIVLWSFVAAVVLAIAGFMVVAIYLFRYFNHAVDAFAPSTMGQLAGMHTNAMQSMLLARTGLWKFILQSCGIIAGVAFGFLGFALFLLGVKGDMDAAFDDSQHKVQLSRMAPGSFVLFIAAILIGLCSTKSVTLDLPQEVTRTVPVQALSPIADTASQGSAPADLQEVTPLDLGHVRLSESGTPKIPPSDTPAH
jgi:hypothetical protein